MFSHSIGEKLIVSKRVASELLDSRVYYDTCPFALVEIREKKASTKTIENALSHHVAHFYIGNCEFSQRTMIANEHNYALIKRFTAVLHNPCDFKLDQTSNRSYNIAVKWSFN